ncbi:MAG: biopolymer transporter ExbD [Lentisphaerae bacterium]|nr:biopolymer transporter ExbD [Lentisphaerota bacterium]
MRRKPPEQLAVPMSSMIDIVFLLLIYFIVTAREDIPEAHLAVNLPAPGMAKSGEVKPKMLEMQVHANKLYLQGSEKPVAEIAAMLKYLGSLDPDQTVIVQVSMNARATDLVTALDLCRAAGLEKLNVVTLR